ncbi:MAG: 3-methyladenine DNA glycosylase [Anaerolineales bacterium]|nr:DNA-3-methyladenine glycosylase [Anaerolineae bacterium]PWB52811.1 MAG: 3-methyladenine DNA glycosylase [Anaerolineales bacterium]
MTSAERLDCHFFNRPTLQVARELLGTRLVRLENGERTAGIIVETEAYRGEEDLGCHAHVGLTPRTRVLYGPPGRTYVYFTYGHYWMLNFVAEREGFPAAVLIRGIVPTVGLERISARRAGRPPEHWTDGPGKLCLALAIGRPQNDQDLCAPKAEIFVEYAETFPDASVTIGPRVGLYSVPEPWKSIPWRFQAHYQP